jgi:uncharacterized protein
VSFCTAANALDGAGAVLFAVRRFVQRDREKMPAIEVARLRLYPVKGLRGYDVDVAEVERCGLAGDRRWLVTQPDGTFLTQRQIAGMARIDARLRDGGLTLSADGFGSVPVDMPDATAPTCEVTVWRSTLTARRAMDEAGRWLSDVLGRPCALAYMHDPQSRPVAEAYAHDGDSVSFADGFPVLLANEASLADLNRRLANPIPMTRFRPNIIVAATDPWAEDCWRRIRIGEAVFRIAKPCDRCIVTTTDQETGERLDPSEPLRTLATFRRADAGVMFGQNLVPQRLGRIAVGDTVEVLEEGPSNVGAAAAAQSTAAA